MKVLLTHSYFYRLDTKQWNNHQPYPPLGTLWAASVARQTGAEVDLFDSGLRRPEEFSDALATSQPAVVVLYDDGFNYLTKMCLTVMREAALRMIEHSKDAGAKVIVCSSDASDHYEKYLRVGADAVIRGEGEETLRQLLLAIHAGNDFSTIDGIALLRDGEVQRTRERSVMRNLDELPMPAWDLVDIGSYRKIWQDHYGYFSLNIATTRGCPFKCNWCAKPIYGNRYHSRSPEHVAEELEYLVTHFQPDHIWMCDDIFGLKPGWVQTFGNVLHQKNLRIRYKIQSRADLLDADTVAALARSGAETVWMGAESGAQSVLDAMDKGITLEQIVSATQLLQQHHIRVGYFLQFGYPGESFADVEQTIRMVLHNMPDEIGVSVSYPLPGTRFYEKVRNELAQKQNWSDSDDLALLYKHTYPPTFYKVLHRYLHGRFSVQKGWRRIRHGLKSPAMPSRQGVRAVAALLYHLPALLVRWVQLRQHQRSAHVQ